MDTLPFGGVGNSGMGAYHGKHTFETFSHRRACVVANLGMEKANSYVYYACYLLPLNKYKVAGYLLEM